MTHASATIATRVVRQFLVPPRFKAARLNNANCQTDQRGMPADPPHDSGNQSTLSGIAGSEFNRCVV